MIGDILPSAIAFNIKGWKPCDGSSLPIKGNEQLFAILQTRFGGDGTTNFNLPNIPSQKSNEGDHTSITKTIYSFGVHAQVSYFDGGDDGICLLPFHFTPKGFKPCDGKDGRPDIAKMQLNYQNTKTKTIAGNSALVGTIYYYIQIKDS